jgi:16S rRNA G966 N2-methylase RsmD
MESRKPPSWAERPSAGGAATASSRNVTNDANLPAFFHVKGPDGSAGYSGASLDDTRVLTKQDEPQQWMKLWGEDSEGIQMDRVSLFSVTPTRLADDMTRLLLTLDGISASSCTITDGTACVGGNTVSFARYFAQVNAVEMDTNRCDMLFNNIQVCRQHADERARKGQGQPFSATVKVFCENSLDIIPRLHQDIVFLDPPWGGKDYKSKSTVSLFLSAKPIHEVVLHCLKSAKYVALKLPKNAELASLLQDQRIHTCMMKEFPSFALLVVSSLLPRKFEIDQEKEMESLITPKMETLLISLVKTKPFQDLLKTTMLTHSGRPSN